MTLPAADAATDWWRDAVTYQIYIRSFADGDGDGIGDIAGIRSRLGYLRDLGVDALWINPWYPSPMRDGGYDVADYRDIDPAFGTLGDAEAFLVEAHGVGLKVMLDIVPNHTSSEYPWFQAALASAPGSRERARYLFRPGLGDDGSQPPNDWVSTFGGSAWTRVTEADGSLGEWYLHLFDDSQPDLDWTNSEVREEFLETLRFWFDRGADGFRIDVAHGLAKDPDMPDVGETAGPLRLQRERDEPHPHWDRIEVHDVYEEWRRLADSYDPPRVFVAEAWVAHADRLVEYVKPGRLHTAFDFDFLPARWDAETLRTTIDFSITLHERVGAPVTWVLSNHDVTRHVTRFSRDPLPDEDPVHPEPGPVDLELGRRRARAAALLMLGLPGAVYLYQGEELGLEEVYDLPAEARQDPVWLRSNGAALGRDGCRVPLPWTRTGSSLGFGSDGAWLPQPAHWAELSVQAEEDDADSMLSLYRRALRLRRDHAALRRGALAWRDLGPDVVAFGREPGIACVVNLGSDAVALPPDATLLIASGPLSQEALGDPALPQDTAVWLSV